MPDELRDFDVEDLKNFKIDPDGELYWRGKKIRAGGWTTANRLALAALLIALATPALFTLANLATVSANLKNLWNWAVGS
jgi:hypothetical protein